MLRATCDFSRVESVLQGQQQARAVAAIPSADGLYFSSDTPLEHNYIYRLDLRGELMQVAPISCSSIYGCRVGNRVFFSTMVEPSEVNRDRYVRVYGGAGASPKTGTCCWDGKKIFGRWACSSTEMLSCPMETTTRSFWP